MTYNSTYQNNNTFQDSSLIDAFGRKIFYLRLAVTDRCNLRCNYCMPVSGLDWLDSDQILSYEELYRLISNFVDLGIKKVRITGGEPLVRKGLVDFLKDLDNIPELDSLYLTTNGVLLHKFWQEILDTKIRGINLSLDTLNRKKFGTLCNNDALNDVLKSLNLMLDSKLKIKINCVVQNGFNDDEISALARLTQHNNIDLRFIEQMPFDGNSSDNNNIFNKEMIMGELLKSYPAINKLETKKTNAEIYQIPNFEGRIGIIDGYSRSFCADCNRIRITSSGMLKNCLYDNGVFNFKDFLRKNVTDEEIKDALKGQIKLKVKDGLEAERVSNEKIKKSMAAIGG